MRLTAEITWVSGWASDLSVWEDLIYEKFPNYSHRFIDYYDLIPNPDDFLNDNPRILESEIVVGWSMGTLAMLRNLSKKPSMQKWILLCPIANFCDSHSKATVRAMRQGIKESTQQTLMQFSALMDMPKSEREKWIENAQRYTPEQLGFGLDYLMNITADNFEADENVKLLFGTKDKVVKKSFGNAEFVDDVGHFFTDYLDRIIPLTVNCSV